MLRRSGRMSVIDTIVRSVVDSGHHIDVVALSRGEGHPDRWPAGVSLCRVAPAGPLRIAANTVGVGTPGRLSLNESLFWSPRAAAYVKGRARALGSDVVIADMLRSYQVAAATGLPVIADLDDLLSARYAQIIADATDTSSLLGYYGARMPAALRSVAARLARRGLRREVGLLARREDEVARSAAVVALVSESEADLLRSRTGAPVHVAPMAVPRHGISSPAPGPEMGAVPAFSGGLDYLANLEAVRWFAHEVHPALVRRGRRDVRLHVYGFCDDSTRRSLPSSAVEIHGYVDDMDLALGRHRVFAAPIRSGSGVKTKVVEAMALGLTVVATPVAVHGIGAVDGIHCVSANHADDFADALCTMLDDSVASSRIADEGRRLVEDKFSPEVLAGRWASMIDIARSTDRRPRIRALFFNDYPMDEALRDWRKGAYPGQHLFGVTHLDEFQIDVDIVPWGRMTRIRSILKSSVGDIGLQLRVLSWVASGRYAVIYSAAHVDSVLLAILRRLGLLRVPLVGTLHHPLKGPFANRRLFGLLYGGHDLLLCMSDEIYRQVVDQLGTEPSRARLVGWAVDLDIYAPGTAQRRPGGGSVVVSAGKTKRDYQTLVDAFAELDCRLAIYCSEASAPDTTSLADNVTVHFDRTNRDQSTALSFSDLLDVYRNCLAVAIPLPASEVHSTTGLTSLLEAMAMQCPVIMTTNTFMDLQGEAVGLVVAPGDVYGWQAAVQSLLDAPELARSLGARGRQVCEERFSLERYSGRIADALREVAR